MYSGRETVPVPVVPALVVVPGACVVLRVPVVVVPAGAVVPEGVPGVRLLFRVPEGAYPDLLLVSVVVYAPLAIVL